MERYIKQRWDDDKLVTIAGRFGMSVSNLIILDGFESFIYEYERDGRGYILRVGHSNRRNLNLIHAEVDWLNYLSEGGARVAKTIQSDAGHLVEVLADGHGERFFATAFVKAEGDHLAHKDWTPEFIEHYGETIGRIHRLSKDYSPSHPAWRRYQWNDPININLDQWVQTAEPAIINKAQTIMRRLQALPQDESYHVIHQDAHGGNFYVDAQGQITLFDFDECVYGHAIYDIAMAIFYGPIRGNPQMAQHFTSHFLQGYIRENRLDPKWLATIPDFMRLREIDLYAMIERDVDWRNGEDPWAVRFMAGRRDRLLNDVPFVDFDFMTLADKLA